jgi:ankyrin repeat protein
MRGNVPMIELLLRNGADPAQTTTDGDSPVEIALRFGHSEAADLLKDARRAATAQQSAEAPAEAIAGS